jgi:hypothetical protein
LLSYLLAVLPSQPPAVLNLDELARIKQILKEEVKLKMLKKGSKLVLFYIPSTTAQVPYLDYSLN